MGKRIVLVEDDDVIRENFSDILADEGFEVNAFGNQYDATAHCSMILPDVVLLDIRLNDEREGGFQLCMELRRQFPRLPIIFFTSCNNEVDKISGLRLKDRGRDLHRSFVAACYALGAKNGKASGDFL
jgi:two-component system, OmpR family, response regulator